MFETDPAEKKSISDFDAPAGEDTSVESILLASDLPLHVRTAAISHKFRRVVDEKEIARVTDSNRLPDGIQVGADRLAARKRALSSYLGSELTSVLIALPGVRYTIEIDRHRQAVVYWEFQRA